MQSSTPVITAPIITTAQNHYDLESFIGILNSAIDSYLEECSWHKFTGKKRAEALRLTCNMGWENNIAQGFINILKDIETILQSNSKRLSDILALECCNHFVALCIGIINSRENPPQRSAMATVFNQNKKEFTLKDLIPKIRQDLGLMPVGATAREPLRNTNQPPVAITLAPGLETTVDIHSEPLYEEERLRRLRMDLLFNRPDPITAIPVVRNNPSLLYSSPPPEPTNSGSIIGAVLGALG